MRREKKTHSKLIRVTQILRIFIEKEQILSSWLAKEFRTTPRTIQRKKRVSLCMKRKKAFIN